MNKFKEYFPYGIVTSLVSLSLAYRSPSFAITAVLALGLHMANQAFQVIEDKRTYKAQVPEEVRKALQELNQRVTKFEMEKAARGF